MLCLFCIATWKGKCLGGVYLRCVVCGGLRMYGIDDPAGFCVAGVFVYLIG